MRTPLKSIFAASTLAAAFLVTGFGPIAMVVACLLMQGQRPAPKAGRLLNFAPVFANREALLETFTEYEEYEEVDEADLTEEERAYVAEERARQAAEHEHGPGCNHGDDDHGHGHGHGH